MNKITKTFLICLIFLTSAIFSSKLNTQNQNFMSNTEEPIPSNNTTNTTGNNIIDTAPMDNDTMSNVTVPSSNMTDVDVDEEKPEDEEKSEVEKPEVETSITIEGSAKGTIKSDLMKIGFVIPSYGENAETVVENNNKMVLDVTTKLNEIGVEEDKIQNLGFLIDVIFSKKDKLMNKTEDKLMNNTEDKLMNKTEDKLMNKTEGEGEGEKVEGEGEKEEKEEGEGEEKEEEEDLLKQHTRDTDS